MKRLILTLAMVMALTVAGALVAQSPQNTTAPGPTQQLEPGQTNNNLPNPGNPQTQVGPQTEPVQEQGTVSGTATESITGTQGQNTTGQVTGTTGTTTETTGTSTLNQTEVDVDTDDTMDDQTTTGTYTGTADDTDTLPATAGELPTVALIGLLALAAAFLVRVKRHA